MLLQALERDEGFARRFFSRVRTCSFGGAALSPSLVQRLQDVAVRACGERILFVGGYGMTEACGLLTLVYWCTDRTDLLGLPTPGVEMKLVRIEGGRWECRVRGPNVFAGYAEDIDSEVFDDEGYFITGDAIEFASAQDPAQGLVFAGRMREYFKLANGTWVRAGSLREALLDKLRPHAADLVIVGENRDEVAALVWPSRAEARTLGELTELCRQFNADRHTPTQRVARLSIGERPPDASAGELTAKGTINVRRLLDNRRRWIDEVYSSARYRV
jgi:feruloyl-CoA synthase